MSGPHADDVRGDWRRAPRPSARPTTYDPATLAYRVRLILDTAGISTDEGSHNARPVIEAAGALLRALGVPAADGEVPAAEGETAVGS